MEYLNDGALKYKRSFNNGQSNYYNYGVQQIGQDKREVFEYDNAGLLHRYAFNTQVALSRSEVNLDCMMDIDDEARTEWRYAYNPMGNREQKRVFYTPDGDNNWNFYPWTYNLLGASGNTLAVYHGAQISDEGIYGVGTVSYTSPHFRTYDHKIVRPFRRNDNDLDTNYNLVFMYPVEYNAASNISYRPKKKDFHEADWQKHIILTDRMGSTKMVISQALTEKFDYLPFGKQVPDFDDDQRTAYIGMELDTESQLGDHGVRKVDYELGRFTTIDPLWEKYYAWSPYQYSMNNPISLADWNGKDSYLLVWFSKENETGHAGIAVDNYIKKQTIDSKGNSTYEMVKDGTMTYYDLWPITL